MLFLVPLVALTGCSGSAPEAGENEAGRLTQQIEKQATRISREAENGTAAIEQALENEGAIIFENRGNLLNEAASSDEPAPRRR